MKKLLFIYNPRSGKGMYTLRLTEIITAFSTAGYRVEVFPTGKHGDARERAAKVEDDIDLVACAGGDGTLNEVINGMADGGCTQPVGYIPVGSTNDFAASLELESDPVRAAAEIMRGPMRKIDLGEFNGERFVYVAAFGAFTNVAYETDQNLKNIFGHAAYILSGAKALTEIKAYPMKITAGERVSEGNYIYGMITNSVSVGGFRNITGKYVALSDGLFEVTLIREPKTVIDLQEIISSLVTGNVSTELVESFKAEEITLSTAAPIPWTLDGEFGGDHKEVTIRNLSQQLLIII